MRSVSCLSCRVQLIRSRGDGESVSISNVWVRLRHYGGEVCPYSEEPPPLWHLRPPLACTEGDFLAVTPDEATGAPHLYTPRLGALLYLGAQLDWRELFLVMCSKVRL